MELPIYYSFKEFQENYDDDFEKWKKIYTDGSEKFFLQELENLYKEYCTGNRWNYEFEDTIEIQYYLGESGYPEYYNISLNRYVKEVQGLYLIYLREKELNPKNEYEFKSYLTYEVFEDSYSLTDYSTYYRYKPFMKFEKSPFPPFDFVINADEVKFKNFGFSCIQILDLISNKLMKAENIKNIIIGNHKIEVEQENPTKIPKVNSKLNQKQVSLLGRLIYEEMYLNEVRPTQKDIAHSLSQIFGFSPNSILNDMTGQNYLDNFGKFDKQGLEEVLNEVISKL